MFERFTEVAREVVCRAVERARRAGAPDVTEEHLLLALLDGEGRGASALAGLGVTERRVSVESALGDARRRGGLSRSDTQALAGLGIDVAEVVSRVERAHGEGALAAVSTSGKRRRAHRTPFAREAKAVLEKALKVALGRGDRHIGDEHILLALVARPGVVAEVLAGHGATYGRIEAALREAAV